MRLTFVGGAGEVTGSSYLLSSGGTTILIDCGLHQGSHFSERLNYDLFPFDPKGVRALFVTHAHIDHVGRIPKLVREGFSGVIYSTPPTKDFAELLLLDSEHLLAEDAARRERPPLYEVSDVGRALLLWEGVPYHEPVTVGPFTVTSFDAGHVLGSSFFLVEAEGKRVVFSGDLGNTPAPFINRMETIEDASFALIESVYGGRLHENVEVRKDVLEDLIEETVKTGGVVMVPAFALERTQELVFELNELIENGRIPRAPVFIDSPLAIKLTAVYQKYAEDPLYMNPASLALASRGDAIFNFPGLRMTLTTEQSKEINAVPPPKVIIAGSGMSQGGRILHHEVRYLSDPKSLILFIGYQARGSLGRQVLDGAEEVKILGETVKVACKIRNISGYSAHADQGQLLGWLRAMRFHLKGVFVVQGEEDQMAPFAQKVRDELAIPSRIPVRGESVVL